jgi:Flp pilus assembly pilin Flp
MSRTNPQGLLSRLRAEENGQTLIEYGGVALILSIAAILVLSAIGIDIAEVFDTVENSLGLGDVNTIDATPGTDDATPPTGVN